MSLTVDARTDGGTIGTRLSFSFTHTPVGVPDYARVGIGWCVVGANTVSVTYGGSTMTQVGAAQTTSGTVKINAILFELIAPPSGVQTVTVTFSSPGNLGGAGAVTFIGADQTTPSTNLTTNMGNGTSGTCTVTSSSGNLVSDAFGCESGAGAMTGNHTQEFNDSDSSYHGAGQDAAAGAGSTTMTWTMAAGPVNWAMVAAQVVAAAAGAAGIAAIGSGDGAGGGVGSPAFGSAG